MNMSKKKPTKRPRPMKDDPPDKPPKAKKP